MSVFKKFRSVCPLLIAYCLSALPACQSIDLYEKVEPVPAHQWQSKFKPAFTFLIKDTAASYKLYFIVRHNNRYKYNNVWLNLYAKAPSDTVRKFTLELPLANKEGWLGTGMDDIYDHRVPVALDPAAFNFGKAGEYQFTVEQIMREDPLPDVMDVGIRLEKKQP